MTRSSKQNLVSEERTLSPGCKNCKEPFKKARAWQEFCGEKCRNAYHNANRTATLFRAAYVTVKEAAEIAQVSETTIRSWAREERIRSEKLADRIFILKADVMRKAERQAAMKENRPTTQENAFTRILEDWPDLKNALVN